MEHITLFYRQGSSDKTYQASTTPKDRGYVVQFQYGRRGATLTTGASSAVKTRNSISGVLPTASMRRCRVVWRS